ncbi:MAG: hypothetical protein KME21_26665 [Desmonostoc vinosum HA7617-LM4]|nr:hypothetical protein [Desmonostoc vinosum HA7617-LM4]
MGNWELARGHGDARRGEIFSLISLISLIRTIVYLKTVPGIFSRKKMRSHKLETT